VDQRNSEVIMSEGWQSTQTVFRWVGTAALTIGTLGGSLALGFGLSTSEALIASTSLTLGGVGAGAIFGSQTSMGAEAGSEIGMGVAGLIGGVAANLAKGVATTIGCRIASAAIGATSGAAIGGASGSCLGSVKAGAAMVRSMPASPWAFTLRKWARSSAGYSAPRWEDLIHSSVSSPERRSSSD